MRTRCGWDPRSYLLVLTLHHIVCDGWSFAVLVRDLAKLYACEVEAAGATQLAVARQYGDYAVAQRERLASAEHRADEAYWLSRFAGPIPALDLPTDRPRAAWRTFASCREDYVLDAGLVAEVRKMAARNGANLFAALLGAFAGMLQRVSGAEDVVVGVPAAGQSLDGLDSLVGHCVNLLPVRLTTDPHAPATALVSLTQSAVLDAYEHQSYTFGTLLRKLSLARDPSRLPLVSVLFNVDQALDADKLGFEGLHAAFSSNPRVFENFELYVNAVQVEGGLSLECQYNADLFDATTVRRWLATYEVLLRALCAAAPDTTLGALDVLPADDRHVLAQWNATDRAYESGLRLGDLAARGARCSPAGPAVVFEGRDYDYATLESHAWALALHLRELGVKPGVLVGVCLERSFELVYSLLGVIYSGGAYVPVDPSYPTERVAAMCEDARLDIIVTRSGEAARIAAALPSGAQIIRLDEARLPEAQPAARTLQGTPDDAAYVIFTSGSTGRPKGAMNSHRAIVNRLLWMQEAYGLQPHGRVMQKTPYSFDVSVWEFFWPIMVGATIVVARPEGHRDGAYLLETIRRENVTVMHFVPSMLRTFLDQDGLEACAGLERVICSGEALALDVVERFFELLPATRLTNLYGPTEAAVDVTAWECRPKDPRGIVPIGKPIANTRIHVLDAGMKPVPIGSPGELYIAGVQVGMGYVSRPDLTAERFPPDPFAPGARLYKTGDIARWRADGCIEHLGRADFQVKVRGFRIELGEIETALTANAAITHAVVLAREDRPGDVRLVAYVVARPGAAATDALLQGHLKASLPEYMIPAHFVWMPAIPLLPNGKIDRKSLPAPQPGAAASREYVAPRTELERTVAMEMETSLGMPGVSVHDDFFALGGHSLLAAQLTSRLNRALGSRLTMRSVFAAPTIERLAQALASERAAPERPARKPLERTPNRREAPLTVMQERQWFLEELHPGRPTYNAPSAHRITGAMNEAAFERAFRELVRRQPVLRTSFEARGSEVVQRIHDNVEVRLFPAEDLTSLAAPERERRLSQRLEELVVQPFDLTRAPLFKAHVFRLSEVEHVLFFMAHHIIWDGWSFDLLYQEIASLYGAFCEAGPSPLPELAVTYGDFAAWHRDWMQGPEMQEQLAFWRARLERMGDARELPTDQPRRPGMTGLGRTRWISVDRARTDALHAISRAAGSTMFITTLAAYCVLLHGYSGHTSLIVGTPVRRRNAIELETIMGYFNNLIPLHVEVDPAEPFTAFMERVKAAAVDSFAHPDVPLEQLAGELTVARGAGGSLLYQALFSFQDARQRVQHWGALSHARVEVFQPGATEDLGMWFIETDSGLDGGATYNAELLSEETAAELQRGYVALLDAIIAAPATPLGHLLGPQGAMVARSRTQVEPASRATRVATPAGTPPATPTEKILAAIWCRQLKLEQVAVEDNFFDLGGHSLLAMQAILEMEEKTGKRIDRNRYIFESLARIALCYDEAPSEPAAKAGGLRGLLSGLLGGRKAP